eukprot:m.50521 g.50521  ORF g.50521 m.50521 type:complete len:282 (+) comp7242_c0_seq2:284-1129(+)
MTGIPLRSEAIVHINQVIGWIYFFAWSLSFYPQVYYNWTRKSVVGLNFDYLIYNITGFLAYAAYNICFYYVEPVKREYLSNHDTMPVQLNDVFFAVHAVLLTLVTIVQCFIYERGDQRVSMFAKGLMGCAWTFMIVALILAFEHQLGLRWVRFLNCVSYVKLLVTIVKYVPQAHMNYRRKSTIGWSIGNVLLDFTGGVFSFLQMFMQYLNDGDESIFSGDPVKLGLAFFSISFDIFFMTQHYVLYPRAKDPRLAAEGQPHKDGDKDVDVLTTPLLQTYDKP